MQPAAGGGDLPEGPPPDCLAALGLLLRADAHARSVGDGRWQFAVGLRELLDAGVSSAALRRLVAEGLAEHAVEAVRLGATERRYRRVRSLAFPARTCFALTDAGLARAGRWLARVGAAAPLALGSASVPAWDASARRLCFRGVLVKRFRRPAPSQELILAAFQEEGWPPRVDDPLPGQRGVCARERLHDAVQGLNRHHDNALLTFGRDREGVTWHTREAC
jgi:hypothetical protein